MKVTLINVTPNALATLVFTKSTRLKMAGTSFQEVLAWPEEKLMAEWAYMQNTIKSSWEFVDYIFAIEGVTRGFTHQLVRHRIGTSFAQQSQRTVDMSGFDYVTPEGILNHEEEATLLTSCYVAGMSQINQRYRYMVHHGAAPQDARGILPTNICTNITFKANLRTLNGMCAERLCVKAQGEFQNVMRAIREAVIEVHPWAEPALRVHCAQHGVCAFPTFKGCPIKDGVFNPETGLRYDQSKYLGLNDGDWVKKPLTKSEIQDLWQITRAEAQPAQKGGK